MGKCYCDYCDVFLTNDSVAVRKQHNEGNRHKYYVCEYYRNYMGQQLQEQINDIVREFEIKVAKGLVRPTYGIPPGIKAAKETESTTATAGAATREKEKLSEDTKTDHKIPQNHTTSPHLPNSSPSLLNAVTATENQP